MPLKISQKLRKNIAKTEGIDVPEVEPRLFMKSGEKCFLCDRELNEASDNLEVDHDQPVEEGGDEALDNLNIVHSECNRFKKNNKTESVRPMLKFKAYMDDKTEPSDYSGTLDFFKIKPKQSVIKRAGDTVSFQLADGSKQSAKVFSTSNGTECFEFCFVELPREAVFNDPDCQPRTIKMGHLFSIVRDLDTNPLHEAPCCRLDDFHKEKTKILMFDGQHKTLASWIRGDERIVYKVYLNITREEAVVLVNSIQSKIKKLPLTPFELATKLSDQYRDEIERYEAEIGSAECSEEGFVKWLPVVKRNDAKKEIQAAVVQRFVTSSDLDILALVEQKGAKIGLPWKITEAAFQNSLLKLLLHTTPLPEDRFKGSEMELARDREERNVCHLLNLFFESAFAGVDETSSENERERARRMVYQGSLKHISTLLKKILVNRLVPTNDDYVFLEGSPDEALWKTISQDIKRIVEHPVWVTPFDHSEKMKAVETALTKNQGFEKAFTTVELTPGYCLNVQSLSKTATS